MSLGGNTTGLEELKGKARLLQEAMREQALKEGVRAGSKVILEAMQSRVPELDAKTTGSDAAPPGTYKAGLRATAPRSDKDGIVTSRIGAGKKVARQAFLVEYGHRLVKGGGSRVLADGRLQGAGREIGSVPAYPALRDAYEASAREAQEACVATVGQLLKEVLR